MAEKAAVATPSGGNTDSWYTELEEYIRQGEPTRAERSRAWETAIGLQAVDGLSVSDYLIETAKEHIEGAIDITEAQRRINSYYEQQTIRSGLEAQMREADVVSSRIAELLSEMTFSCTPGELARIHRHLFTGVFSHAGTWRTYNVTKKEWVLKGETVFYSAWDSISTTLEYDFSRERVFSYRGLSDTELVKHLVAFIGGIWQIHPFCEGNTRTTAVFLIKYLRSLGFKADNNQFAQNSWYFRNALVRANYNNLQAGIHETTKYLELFLENLLFDKTNELKNRFLHVAWVGDVAQSTTSHSPKCQIGTLDGTLDERALVAFLHDLPEATQQQMAEHLGKSLTTVKRLTASLQKKGLIKREGGKRNGRWVVLLGEVDVT